MLSLWEQKEADQACYEILLFMNYASCNTCLLMLGGWIEEMLSRATKPSSHEVRADDAIHKLSKCCRDINKFVRSGLDAEYEARRLENRSAS